MPVRAGDQEVEDEREAEREEEEPPVPERPQQLEAQVGACSSRASSSPVSELRKACSRPAPLISMSRAPGKAASSARIAASESVQPSTTASPWRSACETPGRRSSCSSGASGSVARIVRRADHRLDLGRRAVGDDRRRAPSARRGRRTRRPPRGSAWRRARSCRARRTSRIAVQKPCRLSTSIATVGSSSTSRSGLLTSATAKRTRWRLAAGELLRAPVGDVLDAGQLEHLVDVERVRGRARPSSSTSSRTVRSRRSAPRLQHRADRARVDRRRAAARRRPRRCRRRARAGRAACRSSSTCPRRSARAARRSRRGATRESIPRTARTSPKDFVRPCSSIRRARA